MKILFLYQDIESGAKLATEAIINTLRHMYPEDVYISYKQPSQRFKGRFSYFINLCWSIINYHSVIKKTEADVIYSVMFTSALSYLLSFGKAVPFVFHFHGDQKFGTFNKKHKVIDLIRYPYFYLLNSFIIFLQTLALKTAKKVIFVSPESASEITKNYHLQGKISPIIVENGVDQNLFKSISSKAKMSLKKNIIHSNKFLISYIGRIDEKKGVLPLVQSLELLPQKSLKKIKVLFAFPKPTDEFSINLLRKMNSEAEKHGLLKYLILKQNYPRLENIFQISDIVILPSIQEMFPLVMLEALSSGSLFLSTNVGHVPAVLKKISASLLMKNNHPQTIANSLDYFINLENDTRKQLLLKAKKTTRNFTWEKTAIKIHKVLLSLK